VLPGAAAAAPPAAPHVLRADVQIQKFVVNHSGLTALGTQSARLDGQAARQKATFAVTKAASCNVLTLNLQQLNLQLLGLNLVTSAINLKITGRGSESLGALFCKLSKSLKLSSATGARAAAASLNRRLHGHPLHAIRFSAALPVVTAQAAQAPATPGCKVLDLVLGPLNLDLLGLVVNLYGPDASKPVEVHVTADPAGGVLGAVFCKLANGQAVG
ncbi:MAG: hypothetical protein JWR63_212, partial [Conexibacter sp.]|nr:hypothetical protein [Conexibacter sp.]